MKLQYFEDVWSNLDKSYNKYNKIQSCTKKEYMCLLLNAEEPLKGAQMLENYLSDEIETYNEEEMTRYDKLHDTLQAALDKYDALGKQSLDDFDAFLKHEVIKFNINNYGWKTNREHILPEELLSKGFVIDTVVLEHGNVKSYVVETTDEYRIFWGVSDLESLLYSDRLDSRFDRVIYVALKQLAVEHKLTTPIVAMSSKYFDCVKSQFIAGKFKKPFKDLREGLTELKTIKGEEYSVEYKYVIVRTRVGGRYCTIIGVI